MKTCALLLFSLSASHGFLLNPITDVIKPFFNPDEYAVKNGTDFASLGNTNEDRSSSHGSILNPIIDVIKPLFNPDKNAVKNGTDFASLGNTTEDLSASHGSILNPIIDVIKPLFNPDKNAVKNGTDFASLGSTTEELILYNNDTSALKTILDTLFDHKAVTPEQFNTLEKFFFECSEGLRTCSSSLPNLTLHSWGQLIEQHDEKSHMLNSMIEDLKATNKMWELRIQNLTRDLAAASGNANQLTISFGKTLSQCKVQLKTETNMKEQCFGYLDLAHVKSDETRQSLEDLQKLNNEKDVEIEKLNQEIANLLKKLEENRNYKEESQTAESNLKLCNDKTKLNNENIEKGELTDENIEKGELTEQIAILQKQLDENQNKCKKELQLKDRTLQALRISLSSCTYIVNATRQPEYLEKCLKNNVPAKVEKACKDYLGGNYIQPGQAGYNRGNNEDKGEGNIDYKDEGKKEGGKDVDKFENMDGNNNEGKEGGKIGDNGQNKNQESNNGNKNGGKDRNKDGGKDEDKSGEKDRNKDGGKDKNKDGGKDEDKDGEKDEGKDGEDKEKDGGEDRGSEGGEYSEKDGGEDGGMDEGKDRDNNKNKDGGNDDGKDVIQLMTNLREWSQRFIGDILEGRQIFKQIINNKQLDITGVAKPKAGQDYSLSRIRSFDSLLYLIKLVQSQFQKNNGLSICQSMVPAFLEVVALQDQKEIEGHYSTREELLNNEFGSVYTFISEVFAQLFKGIYESLGV